MRPRFKFEVLKIFEVMMDSLFTLEKKKDDKRFLVDMFKAYRDARKNKRAKKSQLEFEFSFESKLIKLHKQVMAENTNHSNQPHLYQQSPL